MATATRNRLAGKRVTININPSAKPENVSKLLDHLYELSGCVPCGILGWEAILHGGDPEVSGLQGAPDITGVTVQRIGG
jgi:hypothetical protein